MSAAPQIDNSVYARYAPLWRAAGWDGVLPLPPRKKASPPTGYTGEDGATPTADEITRWCLEKPNANFGVRMPKGVVGLDFDLYKPAGQTSWKALTDECGPLPDTWRITSRDDGSGIYLCQVATDMVFKGAPMPGMEMLQNHHRYAVGPGSWHPDTGKQYRLLKVDEWGDWADAATIPSPGDLPWLPDAWVDALKVEEPAHVAVKTPAAREIDSGSGVGDWSNAVQTAFDTATSKMRQGFSRHDTARDGAMALARLEDSGHPGATGAIDALRSAFLGAVTDRDTPELVEAEWNRIIDKARTKVANTAATRPHWNELEHTRPPLYVMPRVVPAGVDPETGEVSGSRAPAVETVAVNLPDAFYAARPELTHISNAARSTMSSRDAVLGVVLTRVAGMSRHQLRIPAIVGKPVGLSFLSAIVGPPAAGKSSAAGVASMLVPGGLQPFMADMVPVGSGEGLIELMFDVVEDEDENGKKIKEKRQVRHNAAVYVDEGAVLGEIGGRRGSTLLPTLRSMWTSDVLGQQNATAERRRILTEYVFGVAVGIQPELAGPILDDIAGGLPQRFIWFSALDPHLPDDLPVWPDGLDWSPFFYAENQRNITVDSTITAEVQAERRAIMRGSGPDRDPLDSHATLARLKVATLLALLNRRTHVAITDWDLSAIVMATSGAVRDSVQQALAVVAKHAEEAAVNRHVRKELTVDSSRERQALQSAARSVGRVVRRHCHEDGGCTRNCLTKAVASKHRAVVSVDEIIVEAERREWITATNERWTAGRETPS